MKEKAKVNVFKKLLAVMLCFITFFLVGCESFSPNGDDDFDPDNPSGGGSESVVSLAGTKVIKKYNNYSISDAVGSGNSEFYYNLYAGEILQDLYSVYSNPSNLTSGNAEKWLPAEMRDYTDTQKAYLRDSIRYQITSIVLGQNEDEVPTYVVKLDTSKAWQFTVKNYNGIFPGESSTLGDIITVEGEYADYETEVLDKFTPTDYHQFYYDAIVSKEGVSKYYYDSPYYQENVRQGGGAVTVKDFYQDALEYAIYMFTLGYDMTDDPDFFDFEVTYGSGEPTDVKVGGWGAAKVSITEALGNAKELYGKVGLYIGLTKEDLANVKTFVLEKIIGLEKQGDRYNTSFTIQGINLQLDTYYEQVVDNILNYACETVWISNEAGSGGHIDSPYPMSVVTDYLGDQYFLRYVDDDNNDNYDDVMRHIEEAEYQSMTFSFKDEDIGHKIQDLELAFEYYNSANDTTRKYDETNGLSMNIGINFYDSDQKLVANVEQKNFVVKYGRCSLSVAETIDELEESCFMFTTDDGMGEGTVAFGEARVYDTNGKLHIEKGNPSGGIDLSGGIPIKDSTLNTIEDGVLYAFSARYLLLHPGHLQDHYEILVDGASQVKNYLRLNKSSTYGHYITLNPDKIKDYENCSYIEVYFDINKQKGIEYADNVYDFKVGLFMVEPDTDYDGFEY